MSNVQFLEVQISEFTDDQLERALNTAITARLSVVGMGCGEVDQILS